MLTVQKGPSGLGPFVEGSGRSLHFWHDGSDDGFLSEVVYFPETGQGAAVMVNGAGGRPLIREILYAIAEHYGWPDYAPAVVQPFGVPESVMNGIVGVYEVPYEVLVIEATVTRRGRRLFLDVPVLNIDSEVVFTSPTKLVMLDIGDPFEIVTDAQGHVTALRFGKHDIPRRIEHP